MRTSTKPPVVLTIAGFDPSSGAGVSADLQVFAAHGLYGTAAITALTVQSTLGVNAITPVEPVILRRTLQQLVEDLEPAGIKIGMLGSPENVREVAAFLTGASGVKLASTVPVVLDPVLRSSSGSPLLDPAAEAVLREELLPLVTWTTPNTAELQILTGGVEDVRSALQRLASQFPGLQIVATGGDLAGDPVDLWLDDSGTAQEFRGRRVETTATHGTGCAFSSALLSALVLGRRSADAIQAAKSYVEGALENAPGLGKGRGPIDFFWQQRDC